MGKKFSSGRAAGKHTVSALFRPEKALRRLKSRPPLFFARALSLYRSILFWAAILALLNGGAGANASAEEPAPGVFESGVQVPARPLRNGYGDSAPDFPAGRNSVPAAREQDFSILNSSTLERNLVKYYINQYSSSSGGRLWLETVWKRGAPYIEFIRKEIEERKLPPELLFLPVIESQFSAGAVSRSGAAGLWQFMKNSIAPFDMKVNEWIDERRDFWKSTQGALRKLEENYNYFGDWPMALAAYNAGLGAVSRIIKSSGIKDYWLLSERKLLKPETIHYVPKLLAVSYILSNPRRFGLSPLWEDATQWTRVEVTRQADLNILAREAGVDAAFLKQANRELVYSITPPGRGYFLKVRSSDAEKISAVLERKDLALLRYYIHTVHSGDTLLALALHYGTSVEQIVESNPGTRARFLKIGSNLMIPALREAAPFENRSGRENLSFNGTHIVKKGETLWSIALGLDLAPELLAEANGMGLNDILREGRVLKTPIRE